MDYQVLRVNFSEKILASVNACRAHQSEHT